MHLVFWLFIGQVAALLWATERSYYLRGGLFLLLLLLVGGGCLVVSRCSSNYLFAMTFLTAIEIFFMLKKRKCIVCKREIDSNKSFDGLYPDLCLCLSLVVFVALTVSFVKLVLPLLQNNMILI